MYKVKREARPSTRAVKDIPVEFLREAYSIEPITGAVFWKERPRHHFSHNRSWKAFNTKYVGAELTSITDAGYFYTAIKYNEIRYQIYLHHLVWKMAGNEFGDKLVLDHIDRCRTNNCLSNLRLATQRDNARNRSRTKKRSSSGVTGVYPHGRRWKAVITNNYDTEYLGTFDTIDEAITVRSEAEKKWLSQEITEKDSAYFAYNSV